MKMKNEHTWKLKQELAKIPSRVNRLRRFLYYRYGKNWFKRIRVTRFAKEKQIENHFEPSREAFIKKHGLEHGSTVQLGLAPPVRINQRELHIYNKELVKRVVKLVYIERKNASSCIKSGFEKKEVSR